MYTPRQTLTDTDRILCKVLDGIIAGEYFDCIIPNFASDYWNDMASIYYDEIEADEKKVEQKFKDFKNSLTEEELKVFINRIRK